VKVRDIVLFLGGEFLQNNQYGLDYEISGVNSLEEAKIDEISFIYDLRYTRELKSSAAITVVTSKDENYIKVCKEASKNAIVVEDVKTCVVKLINLFHKPYEFGKGISQLAVVDKSAHIDETAYIAPFVVIESGVSVGQNSKILPFCFIGRNTKIGNNCVVYPHVTIYPDISIGDRVIIHSGCVIGVDGFGFFKDDKRGNVKIPHIGRVVIEDDVEIFANVCIARGTFGSTYIKSGVKIDNFVHLAHNVSVGANTLIAAQTGISGNVRIGNNVILAGQVGVIDHLNIGDNAIVTAQSGVAKNIPSNSIYSGSPAIPHSIWKRLVVILERLPEVFKGLVSKNM
jgi:UDP-3-O-[3-hydroxymyristoyl] glucosamine N-acyltransferase